MKKVKLLGILGQKFQREYTFDVRSPLEAIRFIGYQEPGFIEFLNTSAEQGIIYRIVTKSNLEGIAEEELAYPTADEVIIIAPTIMGYGGSPLVRGLLGATLIGAAFLTGGVSILGLSISSSTMGLLGVALIAGGISQALSPNPTKDKEKKQKESKLIDAAGDVTDQGTPIPIDYGEVVKHNPILISSGIVEETLNDSIEDSLNNPLYKRSTQVQLPYIAKALNNPSFRFSNRTYRRFDTNYLSNRDPFTGCVIDKHPHNYLAVEISFSSTPSGLNIASAFPLQKVSIFPDVEGYEGCRRMDIYAGRFSLGTHVGLASFNLSPGGYNTFDLSGLPQFNTAYPYFTFFFYNFNTNNDVIAVGELELYGAIGLDDNLANIR